MMLNNIYQQEYEKKFSIIVPCYNVVERINKLINMFSSKDYEDYEVIFIDDCSPDGSYEKFKKQLCDKDNLKIFQTSKNGGPGVARNVGLENAIGEYIIFCDSDDIFEINILSKMEIFIEEHNDFDLIISPFYQEKGRKRKIIDRYHSTKNGELIPTNTVALNDPNLFAKIYRSNIIKDNNILFPNRMTGEDRCFLLYYLVNAKRLYKFENLYYTYLKNSFSITHQKANNELNQPTTFEVLYEIYHIHFRDIEVQAFVLTHLLTLAKRMSAAKSSSKEITNRFKKENTKYPNWIVHMDVKNQSLYRRLIYKAMAHSNGVMIKIIMGIRGVLY